MKFYQLTPEQRRKSLLKQGINLEKIDDKVLKRLDQLSENVIGQLRLPIGLVTELRVNDRVFMVPMATEEASVVAAANHGSKIFNQNGGVHSQSIRNGIFGQIVLQVDPSFSLDDLKRTFADLIRQTNHHFVSLVKHGGGLKKIEAILKDGLLYIKVLVDPAEAMGANKTNAILEYLSKQLVKNRDIKEKLFAILSNYPSQLTTAEVKLSFVSVGGEKTAKKIALLSQIAYDDVYRAVTNNKGIMNGVDAVLLATGNDYRAVEAACGVLANQDGNYRSLSKWQIIDNSLVGKITLPLAIGTVGGSISSRKDVQQNYQILGKKINSHQLAEIIASIGLANNLAAILAIATKGIQAGHMKLQARNLVANLSATAEEKQKVLNLIRKNKQYSSQAAKDFLARIREEK